MSNWAGNEFMREWDKTYVSTNLQEGAKPYDESFFRELQTALCDDETLMGLSSEILVCTRPKMRQR